MTVGEGQLLVHGRLLQNDRGTLLGSRMRHCWDHPLGCAKQLQSECGVSNYCSLMLFCVRQIKVWYKTCANNWPTTGPPKASFRCDGDNDGGTDDDRDDDHEDGYDDEDNEEETSEVDEHQGFFRHVRKHRSPKTNNLFSDTGLCPSVGK